MVCSICLPAGHTAADLQSIDYVTDVVRTGVSRWHLYIGRALFIVQFGVAVISLVAIFGIWTDSNDVGSFIERTEKYIEEAEYFIGFYKTAQGEDEVEYKVIPMKEKASLDRTKEEKK